MGCVIRIIGYMRKRKLTYNKLGLPWFNVLLLPVLLLAPFRAEGQTTENESSSTGTETSRSSGREIEKRMNGLAYGESARWILPNFSTASKTTRSRS